jgi:DNA segregation ATPase FtsK/SpoIIIE-like protein
MIDPNSITYFAETDARNKKVKFGIKAKDRLKHMYVIGKTGMGKSTLLENMAIQDIQNGNGMAFIDPHGGTAEKLLEYVPEHRIKDVIYFAPFDIDYPISFNVMEDIGAEKRHLVVSGLMSAFKKLFGEESFSDRMQYILQNTILALLEYPGATMLGINKMLADKEYRNKVIANITDPSVKSYWVKEYAGYTERFAAEAIPAIQNKIGQFTSNPLIRNIMGQEKSSFDFRDVMDKGKIIIINLSKGKVGEGNANLIGSMIITKIYLAAMSRADRGEADLARLPNFYLYVDEFQSFANKSFADILSEARKYKLNLTIAHQYIEQMEEEVRDAVFGNVGTMITFRVGAFDAEVLEKEFAPTFMATDLVNLGFAQIYLKLMIDGVSSQPFSATTLPGIAKPEFTFKDQVLESSREQFARRREDVEKGITDWHDSTSANVKDNQKSNSNGNNQEKREQKQGRDERNNIDLKNKDTVTFEETKSVDENKIALLKVAEELKRRQGTYDNSTKETKPKISLDDLKKEKELSMQVGKKNPSKENLSSLKDALAGVLSKKTEDKVSNADTSHIKKETKENDSQVNTNKSSQSKSISEVPEEVLRRILKMDDAK